MRVLIIGGGVAGLTLAAKLRQQGREPIVIERVPEYGEHGYSLGLYPFGSCVLHGLGVYESFVERGTEMKRYEVGNEDGEIVSGFDFADMAAEFGPSYITTHSDLVGVLREACGDLEIRMGTTATEIDQHDATVGVTFSDGSTGEFDLVCGCDGIHSSTRELLLGDQPEFETGWVGWTWWGEAGIFPDELVREYWLSGAFLGTYPVPGKSTFVAAVPEGLIDPDAKLPEDQILGKLREAMGGLVEHVPEVDKALSGAHGLWPWKLEDARADNLVVGRVVLCGDAGTAFLPTAGVGASTALRSAAALGDELSRADAAMVPLALDLYTKRTEQIVHGNQEDSRKLAKVMFVQNKLAVWGRDEIVKHMPVKSFTKQIIAAMREPL